MNLKHYKLTQRYFSTFGASLNTTIYIVLLGIMQPSVCCMAVLFFGMHLPLICHRQPSEGLISSACGPPTFLPSSYSSSFLPFFPFLFPGVKEFFKSIWSVCFRPFISCPRHFSELVWRMMNFATAYWAKGERLFLFVGNLHYDCTQFVLVGGGGGTKQWNRVTNYDHLTDEIIRLGRRFGNWINHWFIKKSGEVGTCIQDKISSVWTKYIYNTRLFLDSIHSITWCHTRQIVW